MSYEATKQEVHGGKVLWSEARKEENKFKPLEYKTILPEEIKNFNK